MNCNSRIFASLAALALATGLAQAAEFKVESASQIDGRLPAAQFANTFGCQGGNQSPQVKWSGAPAGTKSFVVTLYDPDAPTGSGWWHWVIANIPANVGELPAGAGSVGGSLPAGALSIANDASQPGYLGACPPLGQDHRYIITVHALKVDKLELPPNATPALVGFMSWANGLGKASLTLRGSR
ncbi:MAG: phospholipid-binding protein, family [Proteobacteria bacterium]|nr:phospholipid-binding protein, family [Pseudomonadota bacterium]